VLAFEDLLAAKVALQMNLLTADAVRQHLVAADAAGETLAARLEREKIAAPDVAKVISKHARRGVFLKAESVYLNLLRRKGPLDETKVETVRAQQRSGGIRKRLGELLVAEGVIAKSVDDEVIAESRTSLTTESNTIVEKYRQRGFAGIERPSAAVDELLNMGDDTRAGMNKGGSTSATLRVPPASSDGEVTAPHPGPKLAAPLPTATAPPPRARPMPAAAKASDPAGDLAFLGHSGELQIPTSPQLDMPMVAAPIPAPAPASPPGRAPVPAWAGPNPLAGTGLDEKYDLIKKLGEGGMGAVYLAREKEEPHRDVALKLVLDREKSQEAADRFKREILATSFCGHENVIEIYDAGETRDGSYFMAMECVPGDELSAILKKEGALATPRALDIFEAVLEGLAAVHGADIVHRDLKPQNFRIFTDGSGKERVKIMDFGIARMKQDEVIEDQVYRTMGGKITGSPAYIAPESITEPEIDARADLYSFGVAMFRVLTGRLPFVCQQPEEYFPKHLYEKPPLMREVAPQKNIPMELEEVVQKLLEKLPKNRYSSSQEVLDILRNKVRPAVEGRSNQKTEKLGAPVPESEAPPALAAPAPAPAPEPVVAEAPKPAPKLEPEPPVAVAAMAESKPASTPAAAPPKKNFLTKIMKAFGLGE
jgi:serine/threonine protein kinase